MVDPVCLLTLEPDEGYSTIAMVSMDLFLGAIDGINDAGFCAALLSLSNENAVPAAPRFDCFDELAIIRLLFEQCTSVAEAIRTFRNPPKYTSFLPCHYIIADRHGDSAVLEWDGETSHVARSQQSEPLICTNHPLAMPQAADDTLDGPGIMGSSDRFQLLKARLQRSTLHRETLWHAASLVRLNAFAAEGDVFGGTLWTSLYHFDPPGVVVSFLQGMVDGKASYTDPRAGSLAHQRR